MPIHQFSFSSLIAPITTPEFFARYWETELLLLTGRGGYRGLPSVDEIESLLATLPSPGYPWLALVRDQAEQGIQRYVSVRNGGFPVLDLPGVNSAFGEGATLVLNGLHLRSPSVRTMCARLEATFGHILGANMYLTPAHSQGFGVHYD